MEAAVIEPSGDDLSDEEIDDLENADTEDDEPTNLAGDISDTDIEYDSWKDDRLDPDRNG